MLRLQWSQIYTFLKLFSTFIIAVHNFIWYSMIKYCTKQTDPSWKYFSFHQLKLWHNGWFITLQLSEVYLILNVVKCFQFPFSILLTVLQSTSKTWCILTIRQRIGNVHATYSYLQCIVLDILQSYFKPDTGIIYTFFYTAFHHITE
jgi:hypothetical protein